MSQAAKQVCDSCRLRKTRCDRADPCSNCIAHCIPCNYRYNVRRRGPKGGNGRRLMMIRLGLANQPTSSSTVDYLSASDFAASPAYALGYEGMPESSVLPPVGSVVASLDPGQSPLEDVVSPRSPHLSAVISAHVEIFMEQVFPIMPVVDGAHLLSDAENLIDLPPPRYVLLLALCAITRIQLRLDQENPIEGDAFNPCLCAGHSMSGVEFLDAAERARQQFTLVHNMSQEAILTSFFLFVSYANIEKYQNAWFYLSQSISMAMILGYDRDPSDGNLSRKDLNMRRKIFWLLFITERTFALQRRMPLLMRGGVAPKPEILDTDCPTTVNDFLNHVRLFETLPAALYDWQRLPGDLGDRRGAIANSVNDYVCAVEPNNAVMESQYFDTLVTQQWLRVSMWRLACGMLPRIGDSNNTSLTPTLPFEAGKSIMAALASVSTRSKDCHGLSIEQKLFDIGLSLVDVAVVSTANVSGIALGPLDLLCEVVRTLGCMRGRQSRYLPSLLDHSQFALGLDKLTTQMSLPRLPCEDIITTPFITECEEANDVNFGEQEHSCLPSGTATAQAEGNPREDKTQCKEDKWNWPARNHIDILSTWT